MIPTDQKDDLIFYVLLLICELKNMFFCRGPLRGDPALFYSGERFVESDPPPAVARGDHRGTGSSLYSLIPGPFAFPTTGSTSIAGPIGGASRGTGPGPES
jgi:hypothetical protein